MKLEIDILTQLRLFEGISLNDLNKISQEVVFNQKIFKQDKTIKDIYDRCDEMVFVHRGNVASQLRGTNAKFVFEEIYSPPYLLEAYSIFGLSPRYARKYIAATEVELISLNKTTVLDLLHKYDVFNLNFMNILCSYAQIYRQKNLLGITGSPKEKILKLALHLSESNKGSKRLYINNEELARMIGERRVNVSSAISELVEEGYIEKERSVITFKEKTFESKQMIGNFMF